MIRRFPCAPRRAAALLRLARTLFFIPALLGERAQGADSPAADPTLPKCPPDWRVELMAQPPQLIHPSVVCAAPDGRVFVAQDPIDMGLPSDSTGDSILCIYPDGTIKKFADNLHAVFGLTYLDGKLYVHHTPLFSVFTDANGVGADRVDLFSTHPSPSLNGTGFNDHVPSNFRLGMDGWFYMSTGDKGIFGAVGKDGSKAEIRGGGIMRFRPDGTQLEVYANGTRNHLDVELNAEDELFTYDNTDDGNGWWTRVTHMVDGGYYGYPYDYKPRRPYTLWMMTDYGGGAPTGGLAYNEDALPAEYQGNLFLCEWGRRQLLRLKVSREGGSYKIDSRAQIGGADFLTSGTKPFRPVGIAVSADGLSLYIADWNYDGWKANVVAGRLLKVTYTGPSQAVPKPAWWLPAAMGQPFQATTEQLIEGLRHPSREVRMVAQHRLADLGAEAAPQLKQLLTNIEAPAPARWHAIWTLDAIDGGAAARTEILAVATNENSATVRAQAIRQLGTARAKEAVEPLARAQRDPDAMIRFRAATALGRIGDAAAVPSLSAALDEKDFFTRYAVFTALNRIGRGDPAAWPSIASGLRADNPQIREGTLFAMRETYDPLNVGALADFVESTNAPAEARAQALAELAELHRRRPAWDSKWWGTQPVKGAPEPKTVEWAGTPLVLTAIDHALSDAAPAVRREAVSAVAIAAVATAAPRLRTMFDSETETSGKQAILQALGVLKDAAAGPLIATVLADVAKNSALLPDAIVAAGRVGGSVATIALVHLAVASTDPETLVRTMDALGQTRSAEGIPASANLLRNPDSKVRAAAGRALVSIGGPAALAAVTPLFDDTDWEIRGAAIDTAGRLKDKQILPRLLTLYGQDSTRGDALGALTQMPDLRALDAYLGGLTNRSNNLRDASLRAIEAIRGEALAAIEERHRRQPFGGAALAALQRVYTRDETAHKGPLFEGDLKPASPQDYAKFALRNPGAAAPGKTIFEGPVGCTVCHRANGKGGEIGPELSGIATKYDRNSLIESVLYPSKQILDGYHATVLTLKNGEGYTGFVRDETPSQLVLLDAAGEKHPVQKEQIAKREESPLSLMPEGLQSGMSLAEFTDLIAYLESLKEKPAAAK